MKNKFLFLVLCFFAWSCNAQNCNPIEVDAFTHYQINQEGRLLNPEEEEYLLKIYSNPNEDSIIAKIPPDIEAGWFVTVTGNKKDFFYINSLVGLGSNLTFESVWIKKGFIGLSTRNYDGQKANLYKSPNKSSKIIGYLQGVQVVKILNVCKKWVYVQGIGKNNQKVTGWLSPDMQCGDTFSTCP